MRFWLALRDSYELDTAAEVLGQRLEREVRPYAVVGIPFAEDGD